jgi:hypothetical protein
MSNLAALAFTILYPNEDISKYTFSLDYSGRFSSHNANVKYVPSAKKYMFGLSKDWQGVSSDVVIGLLQFLFIKCCKHLNSSKKKTVNTELYHQFMATVDERIPVTKLDPFLKQAFDNLNRNYFDNELPACNLKWGTASTRTLGHYNYGNDTITMSTIFQHAEGKDYNYFSFVLYHEMLHKKHKFYTSKTGKGMHHHAAFRADEAKFPNAAKLEKGLHGFIRKYKLKKLF